jgi:general secretion pathway protein H
MDPHLPQQSRSAARLRGFTLLEILIVIAIVGVIITVATVSVGVLGGDREMKEQAQRLAAVLEQAKEECELQGFDVGVRIAETSYDFLRFNPRIQRWQPLTGDDLLQLRQLPDGLNFALTLEGKRIILKSLLTVPEAANSAETKASDGSKDNNDKDDNDELAPHLLILSSGDLNSFELELHREGSELAFKLASKPDNSLELAEIDNSI